ncbi:hypothetical protein BV96_04587 [Sphingomonas paucimobilis]|nr:hypothetical protein BV96_04587 [Sphingomonas paucimobilis]
MDSEDFREAFLQANARPEFISSEFADVIRYLMRAVSADDGNGPIYQASEKMKFVADLLQRCPDPVSWYGMFSDAVEEIQNSIPDDPDDRRYVHAAKRGTKYLVELSATDNAARGRAARRLDEFRDAIRWSEEAPGGRR